jgi:hypothetical protein
MPLQTSRQHIAFKSVKSADMPHGDNPAAAEKEELKKHWQKFQELKKSNLEKSGSSWCTCKRRKAAYDEGEAH